MTVTLDFTPAQEQWLRREAQARGLTVDALLTQIVAQAVTQTNPGGSPGPARIPGRHAGQIQMADDFDEPLPDSFWTGAE